MFETKLLTAATWPDFEALFERHHGVHGGCWCSYHRMTMSEYIQTTREDRYRVHHEKVLAGAATGLLLYEDGVAVAWCQFGRPAEFPAFDRGRDYRKLTIPPPQRPQWRITCLFVDKTRRGEGLASRVLSEALAAIRTLGGGVVEAFPLEVPGVAKPQYTGSIRMYEACGFRYVAPIGKYNHLVRLDQALSGTTT